MKLYYSEKRRIKGIYDDKERSLEDLRIPVLILEPENEEDAERISELIEEYEGKIVKEKREIGLNL